MKYERCPGLRSVHFLKYPTALDSVKSQHINQTAMVKVKWPLHTCVCVETIYTISANIMLTIISFCLYNIRSYQRI